MMVADDEVNPLFLGIGDFFYCLDSAVENDDESDSCFFGKINSLSAHAIPFIIAVGDIVIDVGIELSQEFIYQCHSRTAVYIVVAIDEYAFLVSHCIIEPVDSRIHILHQKRVDEVGKLWTEEPFGSTLRRYASAYQQGGENGADSQLFPQLSGSTLLFSCGRCVVPFEVHFQLFFISERKGTKKKPNVTVVYGEYLVSCHSSELNLSLLMMLTEIPTISDLKGEL